MIKDNENRSNTVSIAKGLVKWVGGTIVAGTLGILAPIIIYNSFYESPDRTPRKATNEFSQGLRSGTQGMNLHKYTESNKMMNYTLPGFVAGYLAIQAGVSGFRRSRKRT